MDSSTLSLFSFLLTIHLSVSGAISTMFTLVNKCDYTVWPGILSNPGVPPLSTTGFVLETGKSTSIAAPIPWGGLVWGRTLCSEDSSGKFSCVTGDCGSGKLQCAGNGAAPPVTLAEFTLGSGGGLDFFGVSVVDGFNVPMIVVPHSGRGGSRGDSGNNCTITGCVVDFNGACPAENKVMSADGRKGVACKNACDAFNLPQYCCTGAYGSPDACKPSTYSRIFKSACPRAFSYVYDDTTSAFVCVSADYAITFCPAAPSISNKASQGQETKRNGSSAPPLLNNNTMATYHYVAIVSIVSITVVMWWFYWKRRSLARRQVDKRVLREKESEIDVIQRKK